MATSSADYLLPVARPDQICHAFRRNHGLRLPWPALKLADAASGGAEALIASGQVPVEGQPGLRRGRQLHLGEVVRVGRVFTGLFGMLGIVSVVAERRSGSSGDGALGSVAGGALLIAAAVTGLGLVIVITFLGGLALLVTGGAVAVEAFRASTPAPRWAPQPGKE